MKGRAVNDVDEAASTRSFSSSPRRSSSPPPPTMPSSVRTRRLTRAQRRTCPGVGVFCGERCPLLAQLTYPLSPSDFLRRHWRRRALLVHAPRRRLRALSRELLHGLSLRKLLHDTPSTKKEAGSTLWKQPRYETPHMDVEESKLRNRTPSLGGRALSTIRTSKRLGLRRQAS